MKASLNRLSENDLIGKIRSLSIPPEVKISEIIRGCNIYQIVAIQPDESFGISRGDVGGYICSKTELPQIIESVWVGKNSLIVGEFNFKSNTMIGDNCFLSGKFIFDNVTIRTHVIIKCDCMYITNSKIEHYTNIILESGCSTIENSTIIRETNIKSKSCDIDRSIISESKISSINVLTMSSTQMNDSKIEHSGRRLLYIESSNLLDKIVLTISDDELSNLENTTLINGVNISSGMEPIKKIRYISGPVSINRPSNIYNHDFWFRSSTDVIIEGYYCAYKRRDESIGVYADYYNTETNDHIDTHIIDEVDPKLKKLILANASVIF